MANQIYVPVLRAKAGEFDALRNLKLSSAKRLLPLLEIPTVSKKKDGRPSKSVDEHLSDVCHELQKVWGGRPALIDVFAWPANATTEEGEHVLPHVVSLLEDYGVAVHPCVGYDRWDVEEYRLAVQGMGLLGERRYCLRFDKDSTEDVADVEYFERRVASMLSALGAAPKEVIGLLDLDDLIHDVMPDLIASVSTTLQVLKKIGFERLVVTGSSIPPNIAQAVKQPKSLGMVLRREMLLWRALCEEFPSLIFGDYGVRSPRSGEDIIAPHTNGKIRYTLEKQMLVARGHSLQEHPKGAQHYVLAKMIIDSGHYVGPQLSWGDKRIAECADEEFKGSSTQWIAIDTNHHIEAVLVEVQEVTAQKSLSPVPLV